MTFKGIAAAVLLFCKAGGRNGVPSRPGDATAVFSCEVISPVPYEVISYAIRTRRGKKDYPCPGVLSAQKNKLYSDTVMKMEAGFCYTFLRNCIRTEAAGVRYEKVCVFLYKRV